MSDDYKLNKYDSILTERFVKAVPMDKWEQVESTLNNTQYARKNALNYYGTNKTWYLNNKQNSPILGSLLKLQKALENRGVDIDTAIKVICSLYNFSKCKTYFKIPERYLVERSQTSLKTIYALIPILGMMDYKILEYRYSGGYIEVEINYENINNDKYVSTKCDRFLKSDRKIYKKLMEDVKTIFFYPFTERTRNKHLKELIFGITYWYNELVREYITPQEKLEDEAMYGKREDIMYVEIPIHFICVLTGLKPDKILQYIHKLCNSSNLIAKHDRTYIDGSQKHYYHDLYKLKNVTKLVDVKDNIEEEGKPKITPYSYIIFKDNFIKSKMFKYIDNHEQEFKCTIMRMLLHNQVEKANGKSFNEYMNVNSWYIYRDEVETIVKNETNFNFSDNNKFKETVDIYDSKNSGMSICDRSKLRKVHIEDDEFTKQFIVTETKINNTNVFSLCYLMKKLIQTTCKCSNKNIKHYIKMFKLVRNKIQCSLNEFKINDTNQFKDLVIRIYKCKLETQFNI